MRGCGRGVHASSWCALPYVLINFVVLGVVGTRKDRVATSLGNLTQNATSSHASWPALVTCFCITFRVVPTTPIRKFHHVALRCCVGHVVGSCPRGQSWYTTAHMGSWANEDTTGKQLIDLPCRVPSSVCKHVRAWAGGTRETNGLSRSAQLH